MDFKKGDRVMYVGQNPTFHNQIGTVISFIGVNVEITFDNIHNPYGDQGWLAHYSCIKIVHPSTLDTE